MYLLYLDESGNEDDARDKHFVLGGVGVFERVTYFLAQAMDEIQTRHLPGVQPVPFHASSIRAGKDFWRTVDRSTRDALLGDIAAAISRSNNPGVVLFAAAIEKNDRIYGEEAVERATEQICKRFDTFLKRRYQENEDPQRGLLIFSEGRFDKRAKVWVRRFRELGTRWGTLKNLSDIPYFASARDTRLLQVADFVASGVFQLYERRHARLVGQLLHRFAERDGILHGLVHHTEQNRTCECPACSSRREPGNFGPWVQATA